MRAFYFTTYFEFRSYHGLIWMKDSITTLVIVWEKIINKRSEMWSKFILVFPRACSCVLHTNSPTLDWVRCSHLNLPCCPFRLLLLLDTTRYLSRLGWYVSSFACFRSTTRSLHALLRPSYHTVARIDSTGPVRLDGWLLPFVEGRDGHNWLDLVR
jgi:hypothetical protein